MSRHIAFFSIPKYGHVLPTLAIVKELVQRGHRVSFVTTDEFAGLVARAGADPVLHSSTWPRADQPGPEIEVPADAAAWAPLIFLGEGMATMNAATVALAADRPDLIVYDATLGPSSQVLAMSWQVPAVKLYTSFASNDQFTLVELARRFVGADPEHPEHPALVGYREALDKLLESNGFGHLDVYEFARFTPDLSLVLVPREFQIAEETFDERFAFVGPCLGDRLTNQYWQSPADGLPILLIAMGTLSDRRPEFFRTCVRAFGGLPWHVVVAVGDRVDPADFDSLPPNVEMHRSVPQLGVLARAAAFVSHAGIGSVMEALTFGVPMVVVPQTPEQNLTGRRVAELGLGRLIAPAEVTAERLRDAVLAVATDEEIKARVAVMRERVLRAGGAVAAADAVVARFAS